MTLFTALVCNIYAEHAQCEFKIQRLGEGKIIDVASTIFNFEKGASFAEDFDNFRFHMLPHHAGPSNGPFEVAIQSVLINAETIAEFPAGATSIRTILNIPNSDSTTISAVMNCKDL